LLRLKREKLHEERDSLLKSQSKVLNPSKINDLHLLIQEIMLEKTQFIHKIEQLQVIESFRMKFIE